MFILTSDNDTPAFNRAKAEQLLHLGQELLRENKFPSESLAVRHEYCIGADIHRGYYNPSPTYDIVIGNTHRGKRCTEQTLKKELLRNENFFFWYCYLFDDQDQIIQVQWLNRNNPVHSEKREYLINIDSRRIGVTVEGSEIKGVCVEYYENGRLSALEMLHCNQYSMFELHMENYFYDDKGLSESCYRNCNPETGYSAAFHYLFERTDGYLTAFHAKGFKNPVRYPVRKRRKA